MKFVVFCLVLAAASCDDKPAGRPTQAADALWSLAPEGARGGIVFSPYALANIETGTLAFRSFIDKAGIEMDKLEEQIDALLAPIGGRDAKLADLGLTPTKGGALFFHKDGMAAVLPIADRDAFLAKVKGTKGVTNGVDKIGNAVCMPIGVHYGCASSEALLATFGKGTLKSLLAKGGARGDIELVGTELPLAATGPKGMLVAVAQLERGAIVVRGSLVNPPPNLLKWVASPVRPRTQIGRSAGIAVVDARALFADVPAVPLVEGITMVDFMKTVAGPLTITVPAGEHTLDMELPLSDPAPATKVLAKCAEVRPLAQLGAQLVDGACRIRIDQADLDLDLWVEGTTLHVGRKGVPLAGKSVPMTKAGLEVATNQWAFVIWGRGTAFAPLRTDKKIDTTGINPIETMPVRMMSLVDEAGFAARKETSKDGDSIRFLVTLRTSFANPDAVMAKLVTITAMDILANAAAPKAKVVVDAHPGSLYAADYAAGQLGLLLPNKLVEATIELGLPAVLSYFGSGPPAERPPPDQQPPAMQPGDGTRTKLIVEKYATDVYAAWLTANPTKPCPASMAELAAFVSPDATTEDEWGKPLVFACGKDLPAGAKGVALISAGPDGTLGTADDIKSF